MVEVSQLKYHTNTREEEMFVLKDKDGEIIAQISEDKFPLNLINGRFTKVYQLILTQLKKLQLR